MLTEFEDLKITDVETLEHNIKKIENMIRTSKEYRSFLHYCKENQGLRFSQSCDNIDLVTNEISIEMHHHIINLYRIVAIVGTEMLLNLQSGKYILTWDIARAVIDLHLADEVSIVSLAVTDHELVHAGLLNIDATNDMVHLGKYKDFINKYHDYLTIEEYNAYIKYGADAEYIQSYINKL